MPGDSVPEGRLRLLPVDWVIGKHYASRLLCWSALLWVCDSVTTTIISDFCNSFLRVFRWIHTGLAPGANLYNSSLVVLSNWWDQLACQKPSTKRTIRNLQPKLLLIPWSSKRVTHSCNPFQSHLLVLDSQQMKGRTLSCRLCLIFCQFKENVYLLEKMFTLKRPFAFLLLFFPSPIKSRFSHFPSLHFFPFNSIHSLQRSIISQNLLIKNVS